jgi:hypothetical protein
MNSQFLFKKKKKKKEDNKYINHTFSITFYIVDTILNP